MLAALGARDMGAVITIFRRWTGASLSAYTFTCRLAYGLTCRSAEASAPVRLS
jgi:hypothetical protein